MLGICVQKVSYFIEKSRDLHTSPESWEEVATPGLNDFGADSLYEDQAGEIARRDLAAFIAALSPREQAELMALMSIGRGTHTPGDLAVAIRAAATAGAPSPCEALLATPLAADFIEMGLERLGLSLEHMQ